MKRVHNKSFKTLLALLVILYLFDFINLQIRKNKSPVIPQGTIFISPHVSKAPETHLVTRVVDGDTIEIDNNITIRYIGIDTPETKDPKKVVECFGQEAFKKNVQMVLNKYIRMEKDISEKDRYNRLLRYVWVLDTNNATSSGIFVNELLVREGYAHAVTFPPDIKYQEVFRNAQQKAREENKGLWNACNQNH